MKSILSLIFFLSVILANAQNIYLVAGVPGPPSFSGDGGLATSAALNDPHGVAVDSSGNLYIADSGNFRIRKVNSSGLINTVAGVGTFGYSGEGGQALSAQLGGVLDMFFDKAWNLYLCEGGTNVVRKIDKTGIITTVAGSNSYGFSGDGGSALLAEFKQPSGIAIDRKGNLYIADFGNHRIRKVSTTGIISTFAGIGTPGFSGDGGLATQAEIYNPYGVISDTIGNIYIADGSNNKIRKVDTLGIITTFAGGTFGYSGDGGQASLAGMRQPEGMGFDKLGNFIFSETTNNIIRMVNPSGIISTIAGIQTINPSTYAGDGGPAIQAKFYYPYRIALDGNDNIYVCDNMHNRIRVICRTSCLANVSSLELKDFEINVFPNPNNGSFKIQIKSTIEDGEIAIINTLGQKVHVQKVEEGINEMMTTELPKGLYNYILFRNKRISNKGKISIE